MVKMVAGAGRQWRAGLMAATAAAFLSTIVGAGPAEAFGLGSINDVIKGMNGRPPQVRNPELGPPKGDQDAGNQPSSDPASEPPGQADRPQAGDEPARASEPPRRQQGGQPAPEPAAAPAAEPPPAPTPAAAPEPAPAPAPAEAAKTEPAAGEPGSKPSESAGNQPGGNAPLPAPTPDYYGERAKEVLAAEKKGQIKLHPVQAAAPDYDILLCEAGCGTPGLQILSKRLKTEAISADAAGEKVKSAALSQGAECIGGCDYGNDGQAGRTAAVHEPADDSGTWMTTSKPAAGKIPEVKTLPAPEAVPADKPAVISAPQASAPAPAKTASKAAPSDDWMARINKERAARKAGQAQGAAIGRDNVPDAAPDTPVVPLKGETQP